MSESADRFRQTQALLAQIRSAPSLVVLPSPADSQRVLNAPVDDQFLAQAFPTESRLLGRNEAPEYEVRARLSELEIAFHSQRIERLFSDTRRSALQAIAGPFGVGKMLSAYDKTGGVVDTIHNARAGVYATDEAEQKYADRGEYTKRVKENYHHRDPAYKKMSQDSTRDRVEGKVTDAYTGEQMSSQRSDSHSIDHVIAAEEIHNDAGRVLAGLDGVELANASTNLQITSYSTNSAMGTKTATEYVLWLEQTKDTRAKKQAKLQAKVDAGEPMSQKQKDELAKLKEQEKIAANPEPLLEADRKARAANEKKINDAYYRSPKFRNDCLKTSVAAGGRAAFQSAMGAILVELFAGIFDEVSDWYKNGRADGNSIFAELKRRLRKVGLRVAKQWKAVLSAAAGSFLSGFLANLVTVLTNAFLTTAKRTVRMIREGGNALVGACKALIVRPEGMGIREGLHEASKVLVGGGIIVGGVLLEDAVSKSMMAVPFLVPFADTATAVIVGAATGIISTMAVYLVDKADVLSVNRSKMLAGINSDLDASLLHQRAIEASLLEQFKAL
ncbi:hypothetical protein P5706_34235 [Pseudomonas sp. ChxA]|jgi:hypothetical protein|uniref:hypothetical protein n=1 Tax=Pseudomonas TaxID=286 RepID=UPI0009983FD2|nr:MULTISPECIES: hypothetical protein [Pseudomonas]MBF6043032.1 hypothetical protein [Pseudomonas mucoides]MBX9407863.1 hypothetical protein [Pseudomonas baetica]MDL2189229.1 hypothetical protein [Pseudomonas sp. ChxA]NMX82502.1 hypothetical protein [Pseudomonas sp. WS 5503]NNB23927.1 hypothetical protein [Pseudomonas fragi]